MLEPIADGNIGEARAVLARGFPARSPRFWSDGLERLGAFHAAAGLGPLGYLLRTKGAEVGIILTMRSRRKDAAGTDRLIVNLSSWYVDERYRLLAPRMMQQVLAEPVDGFTDLTPSPPVTDMMGRLGFTRCHDGGLIVPLPVAVLLGGGTGRVVECADADDGDGTRDLVRDHRALGCIVCTLHDQGAAHLLICSLARRRGVRSARLVFGTDLAAVRRNIGPLARFLLRRGVVLLGMPANHGETVAGGWFSRRARPTFVRGIPLAAELDHAYSEFVFLRL